MSGSKEKAYNDARKTQGIAKAAQPKGMDDFDAVLRLSPLLPSMSSHSGCSGLREDNGDASGKGKRRLNIKTFLALLHAHSHALTISLYVKYLISSSFSFSCLWVTENGQPARWN